MLRLTRQDTAASRSQDWKPVSHTLEAYTTLQTIWILQRKLCTFPHLVYQVWTYFKVIAKPADSACLWSAADLSVRCTSRAATHPHDWPRVYPRAAKRCCVSGKECMLIPSWGWRLHPVASLYKTTHRASGCLGLLVWSFWSTCQASLAGYVANVILMADGQGHLSEKKGQHPISSANILWVANPCSTCMKTLSINFRQRCLS